MRYRVNGAVYELEHGDILVLNQFDIHQSLATPNSPYRRQVTLFYPELIASWAALGYDLRYCNDGSGGHESFGIQSRCSSMRPTIRSHSSCATASISSSV